MIKFWVQAELECNLCEDNYDPPDEERWEELLDHADLSEMVAQVNGHLPEGWVRHDGRHVCPNCNEDGGADVPDQGEKQEDASQFGLLGERGTGV